MTHLSRTILGVGNHAYDWRAEGNLPRGCNRVDQERTRKPGTTCFLRQTANSHRGFYPRDARLNGGNHLLVQSKQCCARRALGHFTIALRVGQPVRPMPHSFVGQAFSLRRRFTPPRQRNPLHEKEKHGQGCGVHRASRRAEGPPQAERLPHKNYGGPKACSTGWLLYSLRSGGIDALPVSRYNS